MRLDLADAAAAIVPLASAELCIDCEAITEARNGRCGRCGSRALLSLAKVLNRETGGAKHGDTRANDGDGASVHAHG